MGDNRFTRIEETMRRCAKNGENYHGSITDRLVLGGFCLGATSMYFAYWALALGAIIPGIHIVAGTIYCVIAYGSIVVTGISLICAKFKRWC